MNEVQAAGSMFWVMLPLIALPMGKRGRKQEEKAKLQPVPWGTLEPEWPF
jgi:hypothetical protein